MGSIEFQELDNAIADLMIEFGPDGHCDGHGVIAGFVQQLLDGKTVSQAMRATSKRAS